MKEKNCWAVVAGAPDGRGLVLWHSGTEEWEEMLRENKYSTVDLDGMPDEVPEGIHVWTGGVTGYDGWDGPDYWFVGCLREPTDSEWAYIKEGTTPWPGIRADLLSESDVGRKVHFVTDKGKVVATGHVVRANARLSQYVDVQFPNDDKPEAMHGSELRWAEDRRGKSEPIGVGT